MCCPQGINFFVAKVAKSTCSIYLNVFYEVCFVMFYQFVL